MVIIIIIIRRAIQLITSSILSKFQWIQVSLPVRDGGLGIRRVSSSAFPAFVASAASTLSLQSDILSGCVSSDNNFLQSYLLTWSAQFGDTPEILPPKQPFWDRPGVLVDNTVVESLVLSPPHSRASFLAACTQHSGDWLFALPIASFGLQIDDEAVRAAVGLSSGWTGARHTNVVVVRCHRWLMLEASIALFARRHHNQTPCFG